MTYGTYQRTDIVQIPINPPGLVNEWHLSRAVKDGRLAHHPQASVLAVIVRLAANSSLGWAAILSVDQIVQVRGAVIINESDPAALRTYIMEDVEDLAKRGVIVINDGMVTFTQEGITLIESHLSKEMRFPCAPHPFSRPRALLESKLKDLYPYEVEAIRRLLYHCIEVGVWKGFRLADITVDDVHAADIGLAYGHLKERGLIVITLEGPPEYPHNVVHPTPGLAELIYATTEDSPG